MRRANEEERLGFELCLAGARSVTAAKALLAEHGGDVAKLNIFDQPHIALTATRDKETAEQFVTAGLVDEADRAQIATVVYNKSTKQFDYTAGHD